MVTRVGLDKLDMVSQYVLKEPMILDCIMFGMGCHMAGLKANKGNGTEIVLVDLDMEIGYQVIIETNSRAEGVNHNDNGEQIFASNARDDTLNLHGTQCNLSLEARFPEQLVQQRVQQGSWKSR